MPTTYLLRGIRLDKTISESAWQETSVGEGEVEEEQSLAPEVAVEPQEYTAFDERWVRPFEGLLYLGKLDGTVEIPGHSFVVRTLTSGEKIEISRITQTLEESIGYGRAYRAAVVAAGCELADGMPLLVKDRNISVIRQRYEYIITNWYDPVIDLLYEKINALEGQVIEILREMGVYPDRREAAVLEVPEDELEEDGASVSE